MRRARDRWAALALLALCACGARSEAPRICDPQGRLTPEEANVLAARSDLLARELGIDLRMVVNTGRGLEAQAPHWLDGLGASADGRTALYAYDPQARRVRIELGYALEGLLPDALVGRWLDLHTAPLLSRGATHEGLLLTLRMLSDRARRRPELVAAAELGHPSGGAGASARLQQSRPRVRPAPDATGAPTPWAAYAGYLDWLAAGDPQRRPGIFDAATRAFLDAWPLTPGYLEHVLAMEREAEMALLEKGSRALLIPTNDPFLAPHFLRGEAGRWYVDLAGEAQEVVGIAGGRHGWGFRRADAPALAPFADALVEVDGVLRLAGGDNRPLHAAPPAARRRGRCPVSTP